MTTITVGHEDRGPVRIPVKVAPPIGPGVRVRVRKDNAYGDRFTDRVGVVESVGHVVAEVRLFTVPRGHDVFLWPFDVTELAAIPV